LRSIVRRDTGEGYEEFLTRLAKASGIGTPTRADRRGPKLACQHQVRVGLGNGATILIKSEFCFLEPARPPGRELGPRPDSSRPAGTVSCITGVQTDRVS